MGKKRNGKKGAKVVAIAARQANLKRRIRRHLLSLGFQRSKDDGHLIISGTGKDVIRALHLAQRNEAVERDVANSSVGEKR